VSQKVAAQYNSLVNALQSINPNTIGAGLKTRQQNNMTNLSPIAASEKIARMDEKRAKALNSEFVAASKVTGVPAVIGEAIASRETHVAAPGMLNATTGMSKAPHNLGYGMMQVDQGPHPHTAMGIAGATSLGHIEQAEGIFNGGLNKVEQQHPSWSTSQDLRAAVDRYNGGRSTNLGNLDGGSTGGDYGGDVLGRAQTYSADGLGH